MERKMGVVELLGLTVELFLLGDQLTIHEEKIDFLCFKELFNSCACCFNQIRYCVLYNYVFDVDYLLDKYSDVRVVV